VVDSNAHHLEGVGERAWRLTRPERGRGCVDTSSGVAGDLDGTQVLW
jgi:hypothetical protein